MLTSEIEARGKMWHFSLLFGVIGLLLSNESYAQSTTASQQSTAEIFGVLTSQITLFISPPTLGAAATNKMLLGEGLRQDDKFDEASGQSVGGVWSKVDDHGMVWLKLLTPYPLEKTINYAEITFLPKEKTALQINIFEHLLAGAKHSRMVDATTLEIELSDDSIPQSLQCSTTRLLSLGIIDGKFQSHTVKIYCETDGNGGRPK